MDGVLLLLIDCAFTWVFYLYNHSFGLPSLYMLHFGAAVEVLDSVFRFFDWQVHEQWMGIDKTRKRIHSY